MAPELAAGIGRGVEATKTAAGALERHNIDAAKGVEAERIAGEAAQAKIDVEDAAAGQKPTAELVPVQVGDQKVYVRPAGQDSIAARVRSATPGVSLSKPKMNEVTA
jgi:hypothetical protein